MRRSNMRPERSWLGIRSIEYDRCRHRIDYLFALFSAGIGLVEVADRRNGRAALVPQPHRNRYLLGKRLRECFDPYTPVRVIEGMDAWLEENGVSDVNEIVGAVRPW